MMNRLYEGNKRITELHQATDAIIAVLATLTPQYEMLMTFLTSNQVNLLKLLPKKAKWSNLKAMSLSNGMTFPAQVA